MARGAVAVQLSGMPANPYPRPKEHTSMFTICELCDRSIRTLDWSAHKNSKKHRQAEAAERGGTDKTDGSGGDAAGFAVDNKGTDEFGTGDPWAATGATSGNGDWGSSLNNTFSYGNNTGGGGGSRGCFGCGETDHIKRDCPKGSGGQSCYNCGDPGHRKTDCTQPRKPMAGGGGGGGDRLCFKCNRPGHNKADCTEPNAPNGGGGGGGGRACHNCGNTDHIARDCPEPRVMRCRNCDEEGHQSRECSKPTDWARVKCKNCENFGHGARRCPEPVREASGGDWGNGGDTGASSGAWGDAPQESTNNWADDTAAAADGNNWDDAGNSSGAAW